MGPLPQANACGRVDGRREESELRLYLHIDDEPRVVEARFEVVGDRSCSAGLSLLTTYLRGKPLAEVEALTLEQVAQAYELHREQYPMLVPIMEVLADALAAYRGQPSPFRNEGALICHCLQVRRGRIQRAIEGRGVRTLEELRFWTRACSGCRSCRTDLEAILEEAERGRGC
jgi:bacterioferritin-associated ferredoxin